MSLTWVRSCSTRLSHSSFRLAYFYSRNNKNRKAIDYFIYAMREEDLPEYQLMLGALYAKESRLGQARKHYETALARGHVDKDMRRFFAKNDNSRTLNWEVKSKLQKYILRKTARRGGASRHRWIARQSVRLSLPEPTGRPAGATMKQVRGLGSKQAAEAAGDKPAMTEFQRMQEMYEGQEEDEESQELRS